MTDQQPAANSTEPEPNSSSSVQRTCSVEGCERAPEAKGLCSMHYRRLQRTGDPLKTRKPGPKRSDLRQVYEAAHLLEGMSPRSRTRYLASMQRLSSLGESQASLALWRNGRPNVAAIERLSWERTYARLRETGVLGELAQVRA